jgi:nicotinamide mononucleotide adenylyltransferase
MKIRELFESVQSSETVGICFGRFNPPHKGHASAWEDASSCDHWFVGTNENTQDKNNPLPYNVKIKCMEAVFPDVAGHISPSKNVFELVTKIYKKYGDNLDLKVYTDEDWLAESLERYNGKESKHGYFKFNSITQVPTSRLSSATALRTAVLEGDREQFSSAAGVAADTPIKLEGRSVRFFDLVLRYLKEYKSK